MLIGKVALDELSKDPIWNQFKHPNHESIASGNENMLPIVLNTSNHLPNSFINWSCPRW